MNPPRTASSSFGKGVGAPPPPCGFLRRGSFRPGARVRGFPHPPIGSGSILSPLPPREPNRSSLQQTSRLRPERTEHERPLSPLPLGILPVRFDLESSRADDDRTGDAAVPGSADAAVGSERPRRGQADLSALPRGSNCQKLWMAESRGDLGSILESHSLEDVSEELVSIQLPPLALGGLSELEDHGQAGRS